MDRTKTIEVDVAGYQVSCRSDRRCLVAVLSIPVNASACTKAWLYTFCEAGQLLEAAR